MIIYVLSIQPFVLYIKLFIMHFLCIKDVRHCHIQEVISQHLFGISTKFFQYSKAHALLLDQVVPKWQSRSINDVNPDRKKVPIYICQNSESF